LTCKVPGLTTDDCDIGSQSVIRRTVTRSRPIPSSNYPPPMSRLIADTYQVTNSILKPYHIGLSKYIFTDKPRLC